MQYKHFSIEEREFIQQALREKRSIRSIAREIGKSPASVSREIRLKSNFHKRFCRQSSKFFNQFFNQFSLKNLPE